MTRLTIHLSDPIFIEREQKNVGTFDKPRMKPKKKKCIQNTLSYKNITSEDARYILSRVRSKYGIAKWTEGDRKGQEMVYVVN